MGYSYSLLGLLGMFLNSNQLPVATLSKALTDLLNPRRQAYKNLLVGSSRRRLEDLLVRLARHLPLPDFGKGDRFWFRDEMSMKGQFVKRVDSFRLSFDLYKVVTQTSREIFDFLLPGLRVKSSDSQRILDKFNDCILQLLIEHSKKPMLSVFSSTFYTSGVPMYFMGILEEEDMTRLASLGPLDSFNQPLETYWMPLMEEMENLKVLRELPKKASAKLGGVSPSNIKLDSPLKPIKFLLKGRRE